MVEYVSKVTPSKFIPLWKTISPWFFQQLGFFCWKKYPFRGLPWSLETTLTNWRNPWASPRDQSYLSIFRVPIFSCNFRCGPRILDHYNRQPRHYCRWGWTRWLHSQDYLESNLSSDDRWGWEPHVVSIHFTAVIKAWTSTKAFNR